VYLLEAGFVDPSLELSLGYAIGRARSASPELLHGPSTRAGGGLDLVVLTPLRLGMSVSYREVVRWPDARCTAGCRVQAQGGVLAGVAVTLPLGEPL
jgi:hypothetical protein